MELSDLKPSLLELTFDEALAIVKQVRANRLVSKRKVEEKKPKANGTAKQPKAAAASTQTATQLLATLTDAERLELVKRLLGGKK